MHARRPAPRPPLHPPASRSSAAAARHSAIPRGGTSGLATYMILHYAHNALDAGTSPPISRMLHGHTSTTSTTALAPTHTRECNYSFATHDASLAAGRSRTDSNESSARLTHVHLLALSQSITGRCCRLIKRRHWTVAQRMTPAAACHRGARRRPPPRWSSAPCRQCRRVRRASAG